MTEQISVAEMKRRFADVLGEVRYRDKRFVIERNGTPVAALVPLSALNERGPEPQGLMALVGAFADAPEYPELLADAARNREAQESRPAPRLGS